MMIKLFLSISFMFSGCLGALDSNGMDDVVDHEYDTLPPSTQGDPTATSGHLEILMDPFSPHPASERTFLINPHVQVNPALAPKATQYSTLTSAQKEKYKAARQLKVQKTEDNRKRKAGEYAMLKEENERLRKKIKSMTEEKKKKIKSLTEKNKSLERHMVLLEQLVRGSPAFRKNTQLMQEARLGKALTDAAKYKEQAEKEKASAEKDKEQAEKNKQQCIESTKKELEKEMKDITLASAAQVSKITNNLKEAQDEVISCKSTIQTAKAKCSELAKAKKEIQIAARAAKTKHRTVQEELLLRKEQHREKLATVSQSNADYYEDEVAQLNASLEVADLETKIVVDGKATREWGIDYWLGQMKSMMHTTPAVTLKLWEYAMNYVEATSAVKRSKDWSPPTRKHLAELRTDAGLVGQICAGVAVAKAKTLLTVMIDETELECSSMQSMITTIEDESGRVRSIALDGVTLLKKKTSEAAAEATSDTFRSTRIIVSHVRIILSHVEICQAWMRKTGITFCMCRARRARVKTRVLGS